MALQWIFAYLILVIMKHHLLHQFSPETIQNKGHTNIYFPAISHCFKPNSAGWGVLWSCQYSLYTAMPMKLSFPWPGIALGSITPKMPKTMKTRFSSWLCGPWGSMHNLGCHYVNKVTMIEGHSPHLHRPLVMVKRFLSWVGNSILCRLSSSI